MTDIPTIQLECKKDGLQQLQNGTWKLSLTVNGDDMERAIGTLGKAPMGTIYMVAMAEVGDDGTPRDRAKEEAAKKPRKGRSEAQECGRLCADPGFQRWLGEREDFREFLQKNGDAAFDMQFDEFATRYVRWHCGMYSRSELDSDPEGDHAKRWQRLRSQYETDTGRVAERRR